MMYVSMFDYYVFYVCFLSSMHDRCFVKVLADVGYAKDNMVCVRKKPVSDVALPCRRVGSKRVKVLLSYIFV